MRVQNVKDLAQLLHTKLAWTKYPISSGTDRRTDGRTDGQTDGQAQPYIPSFSRGIMRHETLNKFNKQTKYSNNIRSYLYRLYTSFHDDIFLLNETVYLNPFIGLGRI